MPGLALIDADGFEKVDGSGFVVDDGCEADPECGCTGGGGPCCSIEGVFPGELDRVRALGPGTDIEQLTPFDLGQRWEACVRSLVYQSVAESESNSLGGDGADAGPNIGDLVLRRVTITRELLVPEGGSAQGVRLGRCLVSNWCVLPGTQTVDGFRACRAVNLLPIRETRRTQRFVNGAETDDDQEVTVTCRLAVLGPYVTTPINPTSPTGSVLDLNPVASAILGLRGVLTAVGGGGGDLPGPVAFGGPRSFTRSIDVPITDPAPPGYSETETVDHAWAWGTARIAGESTREFNTRLEWHPSLGGSFAETRLSESVSAEIDVRTLIDCDGQTVNEPLDESVCPTDAGGCDGADQVYIVGVPCDATLAASSGDLAPIWPAVNVSVCRYRLWGVQCWRVSPDGPRVRLGDVPAGTPILTDVVDENSTLARTCCACDSNCNGTPIERETCSGNETPGAITCCGSGGPYETRVTRFEKTDTLNALGGGGRTYEYSLIDGGLFRAIGPGIVQEQGFRARRRIIDVDTGQVVDDFDAQFNVPGTPPGVWNLTVDPVHTLAELGNNALPPGCPKNVGRAFTFFFAGLEYVGYVFALEFFHTCTTQRVFGRMQYYPPGTPTDVPPIAFEPVGSSEWTVEIETKALNVESRCNGGCEEGIEGSGIGGSSAVPAGGCSGCGDDPLDAGGI